MMSLSSVLTALAAEIDLARGVMLRIEEAVCGLVQELPANPEFVRDLQELDKGIQHLAALRDFTVALAQDDGAICADVVRQSAERISLEDVRARLTGAEIVDLIGDEQWEEF